MKHTHVLAAAMLFIPATSLPGQSSPAARQVLEDIQFLAADRLGGRLTGSPGADTAAAYLARRLEQAGLQAATAGWMQSFLVAEDAPMASHAGVGGVTGINVIGVLPGRDPDLRNETVIVGAHYDHLGLGGAGALDPNNTGLVHNGADDNASGTSALLHIARRLSGNPPARTVVFIAFSGEELGLLGSAYYTKNPIYPLSQSVAMVNLDMVGRLRNDKLIAFGAETAMEFPALLDSLNWYAGFDLRATGDGYGPSDHSSFYAAKLPVVHLFTDLHEDYHRATDDADKIDADGLVRVADFTANLVQALANRREPLTYVEAPAPKPAARGDSPTGERVWFGSIPDMAGGVTGVRFSGVSKGSPAEKAGMQGGDILIRLGDHEIADLQAMSDALGMFKPGDEVDVVVLRDGEERHFHITFASRADR
jgi:hypothetical protein